MANKEKERNIQEKLMGKQGKPMENKEKTRKMKENRENKGKPLEKQGK